MEQAFVLQPALTARSSTLRFARRPLSPRHDARPRVSRHTSPCMMAKFQRKEEQNSQSLENDSDLDKIIPPAALPTLTTLSGGGPSATDIDLSALSESPHVGASDDEDTDELELSSMGVGLSVKDENFIVQFFRGVVEEYKIVEWPSMERVLKITIIIIVSLIVAIVAIYLIDGFFFRIFQALLESDE